MLSQSRERYESVLERNKEICADFLSGKYPTQASLGKKYGVSQAYICIILRQNGISSREWKKKSVLGNEAVLAMEGEAPELRYAFLWRNGDAACKDLEEKIVYEEVIPFLSKPDQKKFSLYRQFLEGKSLEEVANCSHYSFSYLSQLYSSFIQKDLLERPPSPVLTYKKENILQMALSGEYTLEEIGKRSSSEKLLHRVKVHQILLEYGITGKDVQRERKRIKEEKKEMEQTLVDMLAQYCFERTMKEEGLARALAWRYQTFHGRNSRISEEQLSDLIEARLEGKGYAQCGILAGLATSHAEISGFTPQIRRVLSIALHDVAYEISTRNFGEGVSLSEKQKIDLIEMYNDPKNSRQTIAEAFGIPLHSLSYHLRKAGAEMNRVWRKYPSLKEKNLLF